MPYSDNSRHQVNGSGSGNPEGRQRQRLLFAVALLLAAIAVVLIKHSNLLTGPQPTANSTQASPESPLPEVPNPAPVTPAETATRRKPAKPAIAQPRKPADATVIPSVNRTSLPPLQVEVYAGGKPLGVTAGGPEQIRVDTSSGTQGRAVSEQAETTQAAQKVKISPQTLNVLSNPVDPNYPLLAKEMKVQGSVVLQALISREGTIQQLRIVSGPAILANAALEAVRQWRFKPYIQDGEPVETQARITVNFTISTGS